MNQTQHTILSTTKMSFSYIYVALISFGTVFIDVNANESEPRYFTTAEALNDRVCDVDDRIAKMDVTSDIQCGFICFMSNGCIDYFYSEGSGMCVTCSARQVTNNTLSATGMTHFGGRRSCLSLMKSGASESDVYTLNTPVTSTLVDVYCDMTTEGGGWTVWQRRFDGSVSFQENFTAYETGFGDPHGEYWLGLKYLQEFLVARPNEVYLEFGNWDGSFIHEWYGTFELTAGPDYRLHVNTIVSSTFGLAKSGGFQRTIGSVFSTKDYNYNKCVRTRGYAGYWYKNCNAVNPNGLYGRNDSFGDQFMYYNIRHTDEKALKETKLMVRENV